MTEPAEPFVIDVDTGIDDALALLYACAHEEAQILGVSTVVGNIPLAAATRNTRAVLKLAGRADRPFDLGQGRERGPRQDGPRPCGLARARRGGSVASRRRFDHRRRA